MILCYILTIPDCVTFCMILTEKYPSNFFQSAILVELHGQISDSLKALCFSISFLTIIFWIHQFTMNFTVKRLIIYFYLSDKKKINQHRNIFCLAWGVVYGFSKTKQWRLKQFLMCKKGNILIYKKKPKRPWPCVVRTLK